MAKAPLKSKPKSKSKVELKQSKKAIEINDRIESVLTKIDENFKNINKLNTDQYIRTIAELKTVLDFLESQKSKDREFVETYTTLKEAITKIAKTTSFIVNSKNDLTEFETLVRSLKTVFDDIENDAQYIKNQIKNVDSKTQSASADLKNRQEELKVLQSKHDETSKSIVQFSEEYKLRQSKKTRVVRTKTAWNVFYWTTMLSLIIGSISISFWITSDLRSFDDVLGDYVLQVSIPGTVVLTYALAIIILLPRWTWVKKTEYYKSVAYTVIFFVSIFVFLLFTFTWSPSHDDSSLTIFEHIREWWSGVFKQREPIFGEWDGIGTWIVDFFNWISELLSSNADNEATSKETIIQMVGWIFIPWMVWMFGIFMIIPMASIGFAYNKMINKDTIKQIDSEEE